MPTLPTNLTSDRSCAAMVGVACRSIRAALQAWHGLSCTIGKRRSTEALLASVRSELDSMNQQVLDGTIFAGHTDSALKQRYINLATITSMQASLRKAGADRSAFPGSARDLALLHGANIVGARSQQLLVIGMALQAADRLGVLFETFEALVGVAAAPAPGEDARPASSLVDASHDHACELARWNRPGQAPVIEAKLEPLARDLLACLPQLLDAKPLPRLVELRRRESE